jgi:mannose-6-phosphate isomerase-like protein (cupin superfamily)
MAMCHWETDQEHFLVLSGEALLIIEGEERPLRQWDFVHCPPGTKHVIVGAVELPCVVFAVGALEHHTTGSPMNREWGVRTASFTDPDGHIWEIAQKLPEADGS